MSIVEMIPHLLPEGEQVTVPEHTQEVVEAAATLLDEHMPGWPLLVNTPVDIWSNKQCVLGQVYGDYEDGLTALFGGLDTAHPALCAFIPIGHYANNLEVAWTRLINARRAELRH